MEKIDPDYHDAYSIPFQVWRPNSLSTMDTNGCYNLTGFNHFSPIPLAHPNTHDIGIVTGVPLESERIEFQPGVTIAMMVTVSSLLTAGFRVRGDQNKYITKSGGYR